MSIRQGVIISIIVERGLIQKVKNIINKNIEKKRAKNRALGYPSDDVSPLTVVSEWADWLVKLKQNLYKL